MYPLLQRNHHKNTTLYRAAACFSLYLIECLVHGKVFQIKVADISGIVFYAVW